MECSTPVFQDAATPVERLAAKLGAAGWNAEPSQVGNVLAGHAVEGESWAPKLEPYDEWTPSGAGWRESSQHDGDLFAVGSLHMGATEEVRRRMVAIGLENARARRQREERERAAQEAANPSKPADQVDFSEVFAVKEAGSGELVLAKADLRLYTRQTGCERNLVVVLPSHVGTAAVTRIDAAAFSRLFVRGVGVRLLVVPDTVRDIDAGAFSHLSVQTVFLGSGCCHVGGQPVELRTLSPAVPARRYLVSAANPHWQSRDGSLLSKDGTRLAFFAPPYAVRERIPEGVRQVGPDAFAQWDGVVEVVECDASLDRVASKAWDGALWLCPPQAGAHDALLQRGVRLASHDVVQWEGCWYDFNQSGALLAAGPPEPATPSQAFAAAAAARSTQLGAGESPASAAKKAARTAPAETVLAVAGSVAGKPVVSVAPGALGWAPDTLVLPEGVECVGAGNACKGTRHLSLPRSLRRIGAHCFCSRQLAGPVAVPAGVYSIGQGCFEYGVCLLEHTGSIVHVSANQLLNCFIYRSAREAPAPAADPATYVPFDFARYDELLCSGENLPDRTGALVHRIAVPFHLAPDMREKIVALLKEEEREAMEHVAREGDVASVSALVDAGFIDESNFERQIELLRRAMRTDCVMLLMDRRHGAGGQAAPASSRFAL